MGERIQYRHQHMPVLKAIKSYGYFLKNFMLIAGGQ